MRTKIAMCPGPANIEVPMISTEVNALAGFADDGTPLVAVFLACSDIGAPWADGKHHQFFLPRPDLRFLSDSARARCEREWEEKFRRGRESSYRLALAPPPSGAAPEGGKE